MLVFCLPLMNQNAHGLSEENSSPCHHGVCIYNAKPKQDSSMLTDSIQKKKYEFIVAI